MAIGVNEFWLFVSGLTVGWLIEWVIDWVYWRRHTVPRSEYEAAQSTTERLTHEIADLQQRLKLATAAVQQAHALGEQGASMRDPLIDINGIEPIYQERLFAAEIYTFAHVAALTPQRLREIVRAEGRQEIGVEQWIEEAREFAKQVQQGTYRKGPR